MMIQDNEFNQVVINMRNHTVRLDREGDYWTEDEKAQLVERFNRGEGITQISIALQRTEPAIIQQIEKMDLYNRKGNQQRRKPQPKDPVCLCDTCNMDEAACLHGRCCQAIREGA